MLTKQSCKIYDDSRGRLVEVYNRSFFESNGMPFGQVYYITFSGKGVIRGNHYHLLQSETFLVLTGTVRLVLEDIDTRERLEEILDAGTSEITTYSFGPKVAHAMEALTDNAILLAHSTKIYNGAEDDKFPYILI